MTVVGEPRADAAEGASATVAAPTVAGGPIEVLDGGPFTTVQDVPGRVGYWHVGVPPNGPMDDLSHRLANLVVGNASNAAALELTGSGPALRFPEGGLVALGGAAMSLRVDGVDRPPWVPIEVAAGSVVTVGPIAGPGLRATLAVRGGVDVPEYLGSRSTFTLGAFGGHEGRPLVAGDTLAVGALASGRPAPLPAGMAPTMGRSWELGVVVGPHNVPEFLTAPGLRALLRTTWEVHFNSSRTGVRLIGPKPRWARADGGEAGLHPSNIHDTGYAIGSVDLTGDMPVVLGPDGPSLGGFVCPAVVAASERWKLGQLAPGDTVRLVPWPVARAEAADARREAWLARATTAIEPIARPSWNVPPSTGDQLGASGPAPGPPDPAAGSILARDEPTEVAPAVTYRQAGDRFLLVEFGEMVLDLQLRLRVQALDRWVRDGLGPGLVDATAGIRSLLVQVDGRRLTTAMALGAIREAVGAMDDLADEPFPSRIVHLPLSWDDPATRDAIQRYVHGVRADAPWCPWNIEFIRRINGLGSVEDVRRIVFDASYLVLGLGDVYLGAPVATPLDPRHRLITTKYNPARTWTPENAVGIGGAYLCIYGMEGPGGYQFVGRTVQVWNRQALGPHFDEPWLLRPFDQLRWYPVEADELLELRDQQAAGRLAIDIEESSFRLADHERFLAEEAESIAAFRAVQQAAFAVERQAWADAGEFDDEDGPA